MLIRHSLYTKDFNIWTEVYAFARISWCKYETNQLWKDTFLKLHKNFNHYFVRAQWLYVRPSHLIGQPDRLNHLLDRNKSNRTVRLAHSINLRLAFVSICFRSSRRSIQALLSDSHGQSPLWRRPQSIEVIHWHNSCLSVSLHGFCPHKIVSLFPRRC